MDYNSLLQAGFSELESLDRDFDAIVARSGGDGVRRRVGTVGTASPLYSFQKRLNEIVALLNEESESELKERGVVDVAEFVERGIDVVTGLREVDFLAYSSIFADASGLAAQPGMSSRDFETKTKASIRATLLLYREMLLSVGIM